MSSLKSSPVVEPLQLSFSDEEDTPQSNEEFSDEKMHGPDAEYRKVPMARLKRFKGL